MRSHSVRRASGPLWTPSCESGLCRETSPSEGSLHDPECSTADPLCGQSVEARARCHLRQSEPMSCETTQQSLCTESRWKREATRSLCLAAVYPPWPLQQRCQRCQRCQAVSRLTELFWSRPWTISRWSWPRRSMRGPLRTRIVQTRKPLSVTTSRISQQLDGATFAYDLVEEMLLIEKPQLPRSMRYAL